MHDLAPFLVPIFAILIPIVALIAKATTDVSANRYRAEQRRDMLARGIPLDQIEQVLAAQTQKSADGGRRVPSPLRTAAAIRMAAILCMFSGISITVFFIVLAVVIHTSQVLAGAAVGILPFGVGLGFLLDYRMRMREITRMREEGQL